MKILAALFFLLTVCAHASQTAILTTYALKYTVAARQAAKLGHYNRRYHPDSLNVAVGWRWLRGRTLYLTHGYVTVRVTAKDCMNRRYNCIDSTLHIDASPRVMRALGLKHKSRITVSIEAPHPMRNARTDTNQKTIVDALRRAGATVSTLHRVGDGVPDLLVGYRSVNYLFEIKRDGKAKTTDAQVYWFAHWRGTAHRVETAEDALRVIGAIV